MIGDVPNLDFAVEGAEVVSFAATPMLALKLRIRSADERPIHSILLRCQIQIEATRRRYTPAEQSKLSDQFGEPREWDRTLRGMLWTNANVNVSGFNGDTLVDIPVACTYDFNLAAVKYFDALEAGEVPLCILFTGTIFYRADSGLLQVGQIPWDREAKFRLPIRIWRGLMKQYYPNTAWLELQKDVFDRLLEYRRRNALPNWEQTIEQLLGRSDESKSLVASQEFILAEALANSARDECT